MQFEMSSSYPLSALALSCTRSMKNGKVLYKVPVQFTIAPTIVRYWSRKFQPTVIITTSGLGPECGVCANLATMSRYYGR